MSEPRIALLGNPNTGKTTLFNRLCGARAKTANYPGVTVDARRGTCTAGDQSWTVIDLPGIYRLSLDLPETHFCRDYLSGAIEQEPDAALVVIDATALTRNLALVAEVLATQLPTVVALNMTDLAERAGLDINIETLERELGCPVVPIVARTGHGLDLLKQALRAPKATNATENADPVEWSRRVANASITRAQIDTPGKISDDRLDRLFTHPILGSLCFVGIMGGLFWAIFQLASYPMDWIESAFGFISSGVVSILPEGAVRDLIVDGVIGGIAGTVVFLPQICLLFFLLTLLEDTGYLARATFVVDRLLRRFGLPGQAFVPLLSSHACALPGIMCTRLIPDRKQRLVTILVAPFMSCSARLPVYVLLTSLLFADRPLLASLTFVACYMGGALMALVVALALRCTMFRGPALPMILELPSYKRPSLRNALLTTWDRGSVFLRNAGTVIVTICVVLWWLSTYPQLDQVSPGVTAMRAEAETLAPGAKEELLATAAAVESKERLAHSFAGRIGHGIEPLFRPLGYDWQIDICVVTSFAAREVFVSTLAVILQGDEEDEASLITRIRESTREDGKTPLFDTATCVSLLVFYVLALQCLPTLAVTRRETGGWRWALFQLAFMSVIAYVCAWIAYASVNAWG